MCIISILFPNLYTTFNIALYIMFCHHVFINNAKITFLMYIHLEIIFLLDLSLISSKTWWQNIIQGAILWNIYYASSKNKSSYADSCPYSILITGFVEGLLRRVSHAEQELRSLPGNLSSTTVFSGVRCLYVLSFFY